MKGVQPKESLPRATFHMSFFFTSLLTQRVAEAAICADGVVVCLVLPGQPDLLPAKAQECSHFAAPLFKCDSLSLSSHCCSFILLLVLYEGECSTSVSAPSNPVRFGEEQLVLLPAFI